MQTGAWHWCMICGAEKVPSEQERLPICGTCRERAKRLEQQEAER